MAVVNAAIAALIIGVGWLALSRALARASQAPARLLPVARSIDNATPGAPPPSRGPVNPATRPRSSRLPLDQL